MGAEVEEGVRIRREARAGEDAHAEYGDRAGDDRQRCRRLQRQELHQRRSQAGDDRPLPGRVLDLLLPGAAWPGRQEGEVRDEVRAAQVIAALFDAPTALLELKK